MVISSASCSLQLIGKINYAILFVQERDLRNMEPTFLVLCKNFNPVAECTYATAVSTDFTVGRIARTIAVRPLCS